jgi:hypothetical protein
MPKNDATTEQFVDYTQLMKDLASFGYAHRGDLRSFGGPWIMSAPDGRVVREKDFQAEVDMLLEKMEKESITEPVEDRQKR